MDAQHNALSESDSPNLLIPRPRAQAEAFAARIARDMPSRWRCALAPLIEIRFRAGPVDAGDADTLIFTSANGVAAYVAAGGAPGLPAVCVGEGTALAARAEGLTARVAGPDAAALIAALTTGRADGRRYLHVRGAHAAADVAGALRAAGRHANEVVLYDQAARSLPGDVIAALTDGGFAGVTLFSPRSARLLAEALSGPVLPPDCVRFCLSPAVAQAAGALGPGRIEIAADPSADSMLALLRKTAAR
ncbi:MAG: uroporphyrinogen-III synthase [Rhodobacteraceae bacterium]|nr:uroporphyrinogen-III synthase [Paracoccaceae bacterium]